MQLLSVLLVLCVSLFFAKKFLGPALRRIRGSSAAVRSIGLSGLPGVPEESQSAFLVCTFSMLGKLAEADGRLAPEELKRVRWFIDERLKLDKKTSQLALRVFKKASESPLELKDYAEKFQTVFKDRIQLIDKMVEILVEVSAADGVLSFSEDEMIRSAALRMGLSEPGYERIKKKHLTPSALVH